MGSEYTIRELDRGEEVNEKLKDIMDPAFEAVWDIAKETERHTLRTGAYLIAVKR